MRHHLRRFHSERPKEFKQIACDICGTPCRLAEPLYPLPFDPSQPPHGTYDFQCTCKRPAPPGSHLLCDDDINY